MIPPYEKAKLYARLLKGDLSLVELFKDQGEETSEVRSWLGSFFLHFSFLNEATYQLAITAIAYLSRDTRSAIFRYAMVHDKEQDLGVLIEHAHAYDLPNVIDEAIRHNRREFVKILTPIYLKFVANDEIDLHPIDFQYDVENLIRALDKSKPDLAALAEWLTKHVGDPTRPVPLNVEPKPEHFHFFSTAFDLLHRYRLEYVAEVQRARVSDTSYFILTMLNTAASCDNLDSYIYFDEILSTHAPTDSNICLARVHSIAVRHAVGLETDSFAPNVYAHIMDQIESGKYKIFSTDLQAAKIIFNMWQGDMTGFESQLRDHSFTGFWPGIVRQALISPHSWPFQILHDSQICQTVAVYNLIPKSITIEKIDLLDKLGYLTVDMRFSLLSLARLDIIERLSPLTQQELTNTIQAATHKPNLELIIKLTQGTHYVAYEERAIRGLSIMASRLLCQRVEKKHIFHQAFRSYVEFYGRDRPVYVDVLVTELIEQTADLDSYIYMSYALEVEKVVMMPGLAERFKQNRWIVSGNK